MRTSIPTCSAAAMPTSITATSAGAPSRSQAEDRKSTRLNSSHTVIYTLSLHDALPIFRTLIDAHVHSDMFRRRYADVYHGDERWRSIEVTGGRSEEHTSELQSHSDLHSFPTRRSSDLPHADRCARPFRHVPPPLCRRLSRRRALALHRGHRR